MTDEELQKCRDCLPPDAELRRAWPYRAIVLLLAELETQARIWPPGGHRTTQSVRPFRQWAERAQ